VKKTCSIFNEYDNAYPDYKKKEKDLLVFALGFCYDTHGGTLCESPSRRC
jgi:hypothetical protein